MAMNKLLAMLRQKQHDLKSEAEKLLDAADKDSRELTADEETRFSRIEGELTEIAGQIDAEERKAARRLALGAIRTVPAGQSVTDEPNPATTGGFRDIGEFAAAVRRATISQGAAVDARLASLQAAPSNYHEGGGASGEGYMLPVQYRDQVWEVVSAQDNIFETVDLEPTSARQVDVVRDETTPWGASGVSASWRAEGAQMSATKLSTKGGSMTVHELYAFVLATDELAEDAPRLAARITSKAGQAIAWKVDNAVIYGTGAGQPLGWFTSDALVTVAKESGQAADTIVAANVLKMYSRLLRIPGDMPYWLCNSDAVPQLATMTIGDQPAWMAPNGLMAAPGGMLLGLPVRFSEQAKTVGDKGDLQLISPKGYYAARRAAGAQFAQSMHLYFDYAMQAFRWTFRFGGQPHLSAPVSPANGSNTKSHFVVVAERA